MKIRYRILRIVISFIKISAVLSGLVGTILWLIGGGTIAVLGGLISDAALRNVVSLGAIGLSLIQIVSVWLVALAQWAGAELLEAIVDIAETNRMMTLVIVRQFRREFPDEKPDYMKSLPGVWDDAPAPRVPDDRWKSTPVTDDMRTVDLGEKNRVFRQKPPAAGTDAKPPGDDQAFRRPKNIDDPRAW